LLLSEKLSNNAKNFMTDFGSWGIRIQ